jgi:N-acetylneuraminate synthase
MSRIENNAGQLLKTMSKLTLKIGNQWVGDGHPCYLVAEIGINHNGKIDIAKNLISVAKGASWNAVKFQKRTIDIVYTQEELEKPRENPFGATNGDLKRGLEFGRNEYQKINDYCKDSEITWFASCWDEPSVDFIAQFNPPCYKVAAASLTDDNLLKHTRAQGKPIILSVGMSTLAEIDHAVEVLGKKDLVLMHTCSAYPSAYEDLNLRVIQSLRERYEVLVGYSGHETGIASTIAAVALGACMIERHITLDRAMWGSDQAASVAPSGISRISRDIRLVETSMGSPEKKLLDSEIPVMKKLRRVGLKV